jgi:DNA replication protein DnaC
VGGGDSGSGRQSPVPGQYLAGSTGIGKSWIACALGNQAARSGFSVRYQRLPRLLDELALARVEGHAARLLARLARIQLLILDLCAAPSYVEWRGIGSGRAGF